MTRKDKSRPDAMRRVDYTGMARQVEASLATTRQDKKRQDKPSQDKTREETRQGKARQEKTQQDKPGQDKPKLQPKPKQAQGITKKPRQVQPTSKPKQVKQTQTNPRKLKQSFGSGLLLHLCPTLAIAHDWWCVPLAVAFVGAALWYWILLC